MKDRIIYQLISFILIFGVVVTLLVFPLNIIGFFLGISLYYLSSIDIDSFKLPNKITYPLILSGLLVTQIITPDKIYLHLVGAITGFVGLFIVSVGYKAFRKKEGLGLGDAKLLSASGAWLGVYYLPFVLLASSLFALVYAVFFILKKNNIKFDSKIPFGPFLSIGFFMTWVFVNSNISF